MGMEMGMEMGMGMEVGMVMVTLSIRLGVRNDSLVSQCKTIAQSLLRTVTKSSNPIHMTKTH